jgi:hypothetical protein
MYICRAINIEQNNVKDNALVLLGCDAPFRRNIVNLVPKNTASHPRRPESLATPLREP